MRGLWLKAISRRRFLASAAAALPAALLSNPISLLARSVGPRSKEPLFRISLAQWSLHRTLNAGEIDPLDFAETARVDYGLDAVEYVNSFFKDKAENERYLRELRTRAYDHGVRSLLIMVDGEGALGARDRRERDRAVENHYKWVEAARYLGCHSIRCNARSEGMPGEQRELAVDGLRRLTEFAAASDMNVLVENHGGLSSNGAWLASVIQAVDHPRCGTLPDFGNFHMDEDVWYDRYQGVAELMPFAKAVSAKSHDFDEHGNERHTDYLRMMRIVLDAGYRWYVGIEYEGSELSEPEGIRATKGLLERVREELTPEYTTQP
jgi:sugar phosphate isomerase/epimerase